VYTWPLIGKAICALNGEVKMLKLIQQVHESVNYCQALAADLRQAAALAPSPDVRQMLQGAADQAEGCVKNCQEALTLLSNQRQLPQKW
jgi:hypothetical protein